MADTGAPYFIPYVEPTDLVRDYPAADEASADAIAAALGNIPVLAGIGSNVVSVVKTDVFSVATATYTTITGMTVTITPSTATSKILIIAQISCGISDGTAVAGHLRLSGGNTAGYVGAADGTRVQGISQVSGDNRHSIQLGYSRQISVESETLVFLDSPATTSATTYNVQVRGGGGTFFLNRSGRDVNDTNHLRGASSITAIEVAA